MNTNKAMGGYVTIPLRGKRPLADNWTEPFNRPIEAMAGYGEKWTRNDITGYGVLLGTPAGPDHVIVAIDIDLEDYDDIMSVRSTVPYSTMMKRGKKGVTMFFRTVPELARSRVYKGMVDFLGTGRQTVMPPSLHPETGKPYVWYEGTGWVEPHMLPILNDDHIVEMEEMLVTLGWDRRYADNSARHQLRAIAHDGDRVEGSISWLNRQALDNIPSWIEDLNLFNGRWRGARYEAVHVLRPSTTGRPDTKRKRNLSIHPSGIKDFGSNETFSPIDLVSAYMNLDTDKAYDWLAERCDPLWGQKQDVEALLAKGPKLKAPRPTTDDDDEGPRLELTKVNRNMGPLPLAAYDNAPGFIGRYAREIVRQSPRMPKTLATLAGISAISALAARRYVGETRGGTLQLTTYVCAMASTGAGKDAALKFHNRFTKACADRGDTRCVIFDYGSPEGRLGLKANGSCTAPVEGMSINVMDRLIVPPDMTGDAAFISLLWTTSPCPWLVIDELGSVFMSLSSNKQRSSVSVTALLRSWYSLTPVTMGKSYAYNQTVSKELLKLRTTPLRYPSPSLFGVTTPEQMYSALDKSMAEDGTINRFIIAHEDPEADTFDEVHNDLFGARGHNLIDTPLVEEAIDIFTFGIQHGQAAEEGGYAFLGYQNDMDNRFDVFSDPSLLVVEADSEAVRKSMTAYLLKVKEEASVPGLEEYTRNAMARVGENFLRLCYLAAIADNDDREKGVMPSVCASHVTWAASVMDAVKRNLASLVDDHLGSQQAKEGNKLIDRLTDIANELIDLFLKGGEMPARTHVYDGGWITVTSLMQRMRGNQRKEAAEILKTVMKDQGLVELGRIDPTNGRLAQRGRDCVRFMSMFD